MALAEGQEMAAIVGFLERVGIAVRMERIADKTFLPGLAMRRGVLIVDEEKLAYVGDLLHEAGHMAVMTAAERRRCEEDAGADGGAEMAAIAWSYAAALEIGLDPAVVFHADGYKSGGSGIVENFAEGRFIGLPLLQLYGLTTAPGDEAKGAVVYPKMSRWLRP